MAVRWRRRDTGSVTTAGDIVERLHTLADETECDKIRKRMPADQVIGVRMKSVFDIAKEHVALPLDQVEALLDSHFYGGTDRGGEHSGLPCPPAEDH